MVTIQCACCNRVMGIIASGELDGLITALTHSLCLSCRFNFPIDMQTAANREMKDEQLIGMVPE